MRLIDKIKDVVGKMVDEGIIGPIDYPTQWVSNTQVVEKPDGGLRICLDPKPLNGQIHRKHFLLTTIGNFISRLIDIKIFTVLNLFRGFWHMDLDDMSSNLTTFMTPCWRFELLRVSHGLNEMLRNESDKI